MHITSHSTAVKLIKLLFFFLLAKVFEGYNEDFFFFIDDLEAGLASSSKLPPQCLLLASPTLFPMKLFLPRL